MNLIRSFLLALSSTALMESCTPQHPITDPHNQLPVSITPPRTSGAHFVDRKPEVGQPPVAACVFIEDGSDLGVWYRCLVAQCGDSSYKVVSISCQPNYEECPRTASHTQ